MLLTAAGVKLAADMPPEPVALLGLDRRARLPVVAPADRVMTHAQR